MARDESTAVAGKPATLPPATVQKPVAAAGKPVPLPPPEKSVADLLAHLTATGTPAPSVHRIDDALKSVETVSAKQANELLKEVDINLGTLGKVGKFLSGDPTWEPTRAAYEDPEEEIHMLRAKCARFEERLATVSAQNLSLTAKLAFEQEQNREKSRQIAMFKVGHPSQVLDPANV